MGFVFIFFLKVLLFQSCIFLNIYIKDSTIKTGVADFVLLYTIVPLEGDTESLM